MSESGTQNQVIEYGDGHRTEKSSYKEIYDFNIVCIKTMAREGKAEPPIYGLLKNKGYRYGGF